ncbi:MAG: hypothetical protein IPI67_31845 [Myxococcales bacterium]|nr:hypothetical protein [Myxococcales bacterium]
MRALQTLCVLVMGGVLLPACGGEDTGDLFGSGGAAGSSSGGSGASTTGGTTAGGSGGTAAGGAGGIGAGGAGGTAAGGAGGTAAGGAGGTGAGGAGGTGAGGAGGTTGGSGGATGGTGGGIGPETCTNGVDDNGDGLTDCADPQCQAGYTCAAPAPSGWSGIGYVDTNVGKTCPDGFQPPTPLYQKSGLVAPDAACSCGCGTASNVFCQANLTCNAGDACGAGTTSTPVFSSCQTLAVPAPGNSNSCKVNVTTTSGQCAPSVKAALPATTWAPDTRGCFQNVAGSCKDASQVCVQKLAGAKGPCIAQTGDHACPAGTPYTYKTVYFDGKLADTRDCSASGCSCGGSTGGSCGCSGGNCGVQINWSNNCNQSFLATVPANGQCATFKDTGNQDNYWGVFRTGLAVTSPGACPATGSGTPTGEAAPSGPVTVCCTP